MHPGQTLGVIGHDLDIPARSDPPVLAAHNRGIQLIAEGRQPGDPVFDTGKMVARDRVRPDARRVG